MLRVTRRHVIIVAGVLVLAALLVPPWVAYRPPTPGLASSNRFMPDRAPDPGYTAAVGWHFVLLAPQSTGDSVVIDWSRLALEILVIGAAAALTLYALPGGNTDALSGRGGNAPI